MLIRRTVMTKSGIYKDQRDTVQRRVRHRDGKLLRGGIGLTTGLGWSDSEDEDAPSPLTRRLSSLALSSRKSSLSNLRPSGSGSSLAPSRSVSETLKSVSSTLEKHTKTRATVPPTSWTHSSLRNSTRSSTSTDSFVSGGSAASARTSASSVASSSRRTSETTKLVLDHIREHEETSQETSSSASTSSLPMPMTPADDFTSNEHSWSTTPRKEPGKNGSSISSISSIKTQTVRRIPSGIPPPGGIGVRTRTTSTSSNSSQYAHAPPMSAPATGRTPIPRPLRLPQASSSINSSQSTPNTPRAGIVRSNSEGHALSRHAGASRVRSTSGGLRGSNPPVSSGLSSIPSTPSVSRLARPSMPSLKQRSTSTPVPISGAVVGAGAGVGERPKPRTGTGMVYRNSSRSTSSVRSPQGSILRPPIKSGVAV